MTKLSNRIKTICDLAQEETGVFFDLCCDHGLIGKELLARKQKIELTFVDIVPHIVDNLDRATTYIPSGNKVSFLTKNAAKILIKVKSQNVYIIAGIGADLAVDIFKNIYKQAPGSVFVFCINQKPEYLKEILLENNQKLKKNAFVFENGHGYEILVTSINGTRPIEIFDRSLFKVSNPDHKEYLQNLKKYYSLKVLYNSDERCEQYLNDLNEILVNFQANLKHSVII